MLNPNEMTSEVSPLAKRLVGVLCIAVGLFSVSAFISDWIAALIFGLPITIAGICLVFDTKKSGVFSPTSLYVIGIFIGVGSCYGAFNGDLRMSAGLSFAIGCFALARKRSRKHDTW